MYKGAFVIFTIDSSSAGQRVDRFLRKALPRAPRGEIYKLFRKKDVKCNGKRMDIHEFLQEGDELFVYLTPDRQRAWGPETMEFHGGDIEIIFEDEVDLVVYKEPGLKTTPDRRGEDCLSLRVQSYLQDACSRTFRPSPLGRLDKDTEGLVLFAKNYQRSKELEELQRNSFIKKLYLALIFGTIREGLCELRVEKVSQGTGMKESQDGKLARTIFRILDQKGDYALVEAELLTGRTHQIRLSLQSLGAELIGDQRYGRGKGGQRLICYQLAWQDKQVVHVSEAFKEEIRKVGLDETRANPSSADPAL